MAFASIHVPQMIVQAVMRHEPHLRAGSLAIVDGTPPLVKVIAANDSALAAGIQPGMAKSQAAQFAGVEIRNRAPAQEKAAHATLLDLGWSISPRIENTAPDTIVLDLAGLNHLFGSDDGIAQELQHRALLLGLAANVAVAETIDVAIVASRGFSGVTVIPPGEEPARLGILPVKVLLPSHELLETLDRWGIRTCRDLAALPPLDLSERMGQEGVRLHQLASGIACRSLALAEPGVHFEEELELDTPEEELEPISFLLGRLLDQLCSRLQARSLAVTAVHLKFILFDLFEKDPEIIQKTSVPAADPKIYAKVLTLPVAMRDSKMLLKLLRLQLQADPPPGSIVKIILSADPARRRAAQTGLFVPSSPDPEKLELTTARLAKLVGEKNLGSPELVDSHRPGQFRMARFIPPTEENQAPQRKNKSDPNQSNHAAKSAPETAASENNASESPRRSSLGFRAFRPRLPATIELRDERPSRIFFRGVFGQVTAVSGPWRTSGDWWTENAWLHDEWDVEVRLGSSSHAPRNKVSTSRPEIVRAQTPSAQPAQSATGIYCIYFDSIAQTWFVRGMYD
jgi:protein ImuB